MTAGFVTSQIEGMKNDVTAQARFRWVLCVVAHAGE